MIEQILASVTEYWLTILAIFLLICCSGFFSGSETALTATSRARMHSIEINGDDRAGVVNRLIERRDRLIGALLIGMTRAYGQQYAAEWIDIATYGVLVVTLLVRPQGLFGIRLRTS